MMCDLPDCTNPREFVARAGQWTPDGQGIAFSDSTDPKNIWVQPIDGGAPHPLTKFTDKTIQGLRVVARRQAPGDHAWHRSGRHGADQGDPVGEGARRWVP